MVRHGLVHAARPLLIVAVAALAASCGGGGGGSATPSLGTGGAAATAAPTGSGTLSFQIAVPSGNSASTARLPKYVSPNTASLTVTLQGQTTPLVTANLSSTAPGCSVTTGGYVCTVTFSAPAGNDTFQIATYSGTNGTGSQLSVATLVQSVTANATAKVPLALSGVVATVAVILGTTSIPVGTPASVAVTVVAYDGSGNIIVGPGSFSTAVTLTDSDTSGVTALSTTSVPGPGTSVTLNYNGNSTVGATITPYIGSTPGTPATFAPTGYAVANYNVPVTDYWDDSYGALAAGPDGNLWYGTYGIIGKVSPQGAFTEYNGANGIPDDWISTLVGGSGAADDVVWFGAEEYNGDYGWYGQLGSITPSGTVTPVSSVTINGGDCSPPSGGTCEDPYSMVLGPDGNIWFGDYAGYIGVIYTSGASSGTAQEWYLSNFCDCGTDPEQIAFGSDGKLYVADASGSGYVDQVTIASGAPTAVVQMQVPSYCDVVALASGPDGNIWFGDDCANVGVVSPSNFTTAAMQEWSIAGVTDDDDVCPLLASSPGGVWFTDGAGDGAIYRITNLSGVAGDTSFTSGTPPPATTSTPPEIIPVTAFTSYSDVFGATLGPDGNMWTVADSETPIAIAKVIYGAAGSGATVLSSTMRGITATARTLGPMSRTKFQRKHHGHHAKYAALHRKLGQ